VPASVARDAGYRLITPERRVGLGWTLALSLAFGALFLPIATADRWLGGGAIVAHQAAPYTARLPNLGMSWDEHGRLIARGGRIIVARGEVATPQQAYLAQAARASQGSGWMALFGLLLAFTLTGLLLSAYLRTSQRGRLVQVQVTIFAAALAFAALAKALLMFTSLSPFLLPVGSLALLFAALVDRSAGIGTAVAMGLVVATLTPFDAPVGLVLATQGLASTLALVRGRKRRDFMFAGLVGAVAAIAAYVGVYFLYAQGLPTGELLDPAHSPLVASVIGGLLLGPTAVLLRPLVERAIGQISKARLIELADLQNPLLRQIASQSPGTWQHSLAMANMAEVAANAIGANALLTRCGAYYHDLGKSLQPQYYIENLGPGMASPHDALPPEVSADAIFSHVTEGVRVGRAHGLPEPIIDFMHMHHGDGLLEYFWSKAQEQGNPRGLTERDFRYPGVPPQSRETAILCICDAVEAASRTLKQPDAKMIQALVQRIVYGKLHLGQLDESGLSVADLKILAATLVQTLEHAHHVRIEYPWQREARALAAAAAAAAGRSDELTVAATPEAREGALVTRPLGSPQTLPAASSGGIPTVSGRAETGRFVGMHQLDSADAPRQVFADVANDGTRTVVGGPVTGPQAAQSGSLAPATQRGVPVLPTPPAVPSADRPFVDDDGPPPPPPRPTTVELLKDVAAQALPVPNMEALAPGTLVIGAPPATNPRLRVATPPPGTSAELERFDRAITSPSGAPEVIHADDESDTGPIITQAVPPASMTPPRRRPPGNTRRG
jgi:putative nucleotidyltransferase with HDIG domain